MAEYQRFISYIYAYENGKKGKNTGFAKIECRDGNCKLYMSILFSEIFKEEGKNSDVLVYLYTREQTGIRKHLLGTISAEEFGGRNQNTVFRITQRQEALKQPIEAYGGLLICTSEFLKNNQGLSLIYASEWDDISIKADEFREPEVTEPSINEGDVEEPLKETLENSAEKEQGESGTLEVAYISSDEYETVDAVPVNSESASIAVEQKEEKTSVDVEQAGPEESEALESASFVDSKSEKEPQLQKEHQEKGPESNFFQKLCNCYPKVQVKELNGECVRITPHDISYLPKQYWGLCNNSFLLHGYYNYRYLLLCERVMNGKKVHILAVPGLFHQREQTIAKMFGFGEFAGNQRNTPMNFGFWCMRL